MRFIRLESDDKIELLLEREGEFISVSELLGVNERRLDLKDVFGRMDEIESDLKKRQFSIFMSVV